MPEGPGELMGTQEIQKRKDVEAWIKKHRRPRPAASDDDEPA